MRLFALATALAVLALAPAAGFARAASDPCTGTHTNVVLVPLNTVLFGSPLGWRAGQAADTDGVESYYFDVVIPAVTGCKATLHVNSSASSDYSMSLHWFGADWTHYEPVPGEGDGCDGFRLDVQDYSCHVADPNITHGVVDGLLGAQVSVTVTMSPW